MDRLTDEQMREVEDAIRNDPRFLSGGARRYFRRVWLGYLILALGCIIGIWAFTSRADENLRKDINKLNVISCISSIKIFEKYDDFVDSAIQTQRQNLVVAKQEHDAKRMKIAQSAIKRYASDKVIPPTPLQCRKPVLRN